MLEQLSHSTFFNINIFTIDHWGSHSATVILGLAFVISFFVAWLFFNLDLKKESVFLVLVAAFYLVFAWNFFANTFDTVRLDLARFHQNSGKNLSEALCEIDKTQGMGGFYCVLSKYLFEISVLIPHDAKIMPVFNEAVALYPSYFLMQDYQLKKTIADADYLIFFVPDGNYALSADGHFADRTLSEQSSSSWQLFAKFDEQIYILKRL